MNYAFYGTYLTAQVENVISSATDSLSITQIAKILSPNPDRNLKIRIRRSITQLEAEGIIEKGVNRPYGHINTYTYQINNLSTMDETKSILKRMAQKTQEANAKMMASMAKPMIPALEKMFAERIQQISKSVEDGGILKEGEKNAGYWITANEHGQLIISEAALTYNPELDGMVMSRPANVYGLQQILSQNEG